MITIIHGGQTGTDRGAHEAAIGSGWSVAGYMPRDRRDELGTIPEEVARFLTAHEKTSYAARTAANVRAATAALLVVREAGDPRETPGTAMTLEMAEERRLRCLVVDPSGDPATIARWIWTTLLVTRRQQLSLLDQSLDLTPAGLLVAGPRESKWPGACVQTRVLLCRVAVALTEIARPEVQGRDPTRARR
jgi:hypothetical protein